MIYQIDKSKPVFNETNFIAPNATVIGNVILEEDASVWFNVVIRGDNDPIVIGKKVMFKMVQFFTLTLGRHLTSVKVSR